MPPKRRTPENPLKSITELELSVSKPTFSLKFPLTAKIEVNGPGRHPIYQWLTSEFAGDMEWNFEKFLIGRDGKVVRRYPPATKPDDKGLLQDVAELL